MLKTDYDSNNLPKASSLLKNFKIVTNLVREGKVLSAYTPTYGGVAEAIMKMSFGNDIGFKFNDSITMNDIFGYSYGSFILELSDDIDVGVELGRTTEDEYISYKNSSIALNSLLKAYEDKLESVYSCNIKTKGDKIPTYSFDNKCNRSASVKVSKPKFLIPVFPGTNCEYDSAKAVEAVGGEAEIFVIKNLTSEGISQSVETFANKIKQSQVIFIPGGFSGGDEPDGSGKFITAFFRNPEIKEQVTVLLNNRDGLMCGICNGFQALVKLGLVPYGKIIDTDASCPTLTFNSIARHQSRIVRTRVSSNMSPWLSECNVGDVYMVPISHGEGRFLCSDELLVELAKNGQIATQYVDMIGNPTDDIRFNPNNSVCAIEGITSPDGRVIGKMGHSERIGNGLYKNVIGNFDIGMFKNAVKYFK